MIYYEETSIFIILYNFTAKPCNSEYEFTCSISKQCIPIYDVCDSIEHCDDKTDEFDCQNYFKNDKFSLLKPVPISQENLEYDDLVERQKSIIDHLKELEEQKLFKNNKEDKNDIVFKTPNGYLESFMKPVIDIKSTKASTKSRITTFFSNKQSDKLIINGILKFSNCIVKMLCRPSILSFVCLTIYHFNCPLKLMFLILYIVYIINI